MRAEPWCFRAAESADGQDWRVYPEPVLRPNQAWEQTRLFYPTVLRLSGTYLMWYGSYSSYTPGPFKTALGFAVSRDGIHWHKFSRNPVFGPDESRPWESHYTTSQSVVRRADGSFRIWYASRSKA